MGKRLIWIAVAIFALVLITGFVKPIGDYLWYAQDAGKPEVFALQYTQRSLLFSASFAFSTFFLFFCLKGVLPKAAVYSGVPEGWGPLLIGITDVLQKKGPSAIRWLSIVLGFLFASSFSGNWMLLAVASHATTFGMRDPLFNLDDGFYVFTLPWLDAVAGALLGLCMLTLAISVGIRSLYWALARPSGARIPGKFLDTSLVVLIGITVLTWGGNMWLWRYGYTVSDNPLMTGAGYSDSLRAQFTTITCYVLAASFLLWIASRRLWVLAIPVAFWAVMVVIVPSFVQNFVVNPDWANKEAPFAQRAMDATRFGYGLQSIRAQEFPGADKPTPQEVVDSKVTLDNMRLWDPTVLNQALESIQGLRSYFTFDDVDVDRYTIGGQKRMVMIAARNLQLEGLSQESQRWMNTHLQYTHGYGVTMTQVNESDEMGKPVFIASDIPQKSPADIPIPQPRIYYSDFGDRDPGYVFVHTKTDETDYVTDDGKTQTSRWEGSGGIPVGSLGTKLLFSSVLGDNNLLISPDIADGAKLLMHRDVRDRVALLYPFFQFDQDPYIVALNGHLIWVLDGYVTSDAVPYSQLSDWRDARVNYIRNPLKVTVDAYTGEVEGYVIDPTEPITQTYRKILPGLFKDVSEAPAGLREHFRYPEEMFRLQAGTLTRYHVQDPRQFLTNVDAWDIPFNRGLSGDRTQLDPYYVLMKVPAEQRAAFMLILPFTPRQKDNMSGWLAAECDPDEYGKLILYDFSKGTAVNGPAQEESQFIQDKTIADLNRQLNNDQSKIVVGNLLVMPLGNSVMYVEPLFLQDITAGSRPIPELKKVILALKGTEPVVADSYQEALADLFGAAQPGTGQIVSTASGAPNAPVTGTTEQRDAAAALQIMDQAEGALKSGDFATYGAKLKQLKEKLEAIAGQSNPPKKTSP